MELELKRLQANLEYILKCDRLAKKGSIFGQFGLNGEWRHIYYLINDIYPVLSRCDKFDEELLLALKNDIIYLLDIESGTKIISKGELEKFFNNLTKNLSKFDESVVAKTEETFNFQYLKNGEILKFGVNYDESKEMKLFNSELVELMCNKMVKFERGGSELCGPFFPDLKAEIVESLVEGGYKCFRLKMFGSNCLDILPDSEPIFIKSVEPEKEFHQPLDLIVPISEPGEKVILKVNYYNDKKILTESKFEFCNVENIKTYINELWADQVFYRKKITVNKDEVFCIKNCTLQESDNDEYLDTFSEEGGIIRNVRVLIMSFMLLEVQEKHLIGGLYDALAAPMTDIGNAQLEELEEILQSCNTLKTAYAPFTAFIQSSGFGKTKLCLESLKKHPGIYIVFRRENDSGIPAMANWMKRFQNFVLDGKKDDFPDDRSKLNDTRVGKFLLGLLSILEEYRKCFEIRMKYLKSKKFKKPKSDEDIKWKVVDILGDLFMQDPILVEENESFKDFNPDFDSLNLMYKSMNIIDYRIELNHVFNELIKVLPKGSREFPFLLYLDELELMTFTTQPAFGRVSAVNIVRRALHIVDISFNFMVVAIGTNSDALSLSPAVRDDSLRIPKRENLIPASFLSGNWEVLSCAIKYFEPELSVDNLRNRALFNVLVSFGRALWSSCPLSNVITAAETKLKNGNRNSLGSLLALLLVRANISVNTQHVLARNLIRSYMAIVSYVSSDSRDLKIGYSSEPVLAMASRSMLKQKSTRTESFEALKEFLEKGVIDKGRVIEALFEYISLFALDDADRVPDLFDDPKNVPKQFKKLTECKSHILEIIDVLKKDTEWEEEDENACESMEIDSAAAAVQMDTDLTEEVAAEFASVSIHSSNVEEKTREFAEISYSDKKERHYHVCTVRNYLKSLFGDERFGGVEKMINTPLLDGIVNASHFVQLEHLKKGDFEGLNNVPNIESMKKRVIDKALLVCGILRQCGFVMPPNYFGIDYIVPFVFKCTRTQETIYSFIAFQSKTRKENNYECASKMAMNLHYCLCSNPNHTKKSECSPEKKCTTFEEYQEICENQISILLIAAESEINNFESKICLSLKGVEITYDFPKNPANIKEKDPQNDSFLKRMKKMKNNDGNELKIEVIYPPASIFAEEAWSYERELKNSLPLNEQIKSPLCKLIPYPDYLKTLKCSQPSAIIQKNHDNNLTILQMIWNEPIVKESIVVEAKKSKTDLDRNSPSTTSPNVNQFKIFKRANTCIICHGISSFKHLFNNDGNKIIKYIIDFESSNFHNVDYLQLPLVQGSMLRGKFSPYYQVNPLLLGMKGLKEVSNPTENYSQFYTPKEWQNSVDRCITGPVDVTVTGKIVDNEKMDEEKDFFAEDNFSSSDDDSIYVLEEEEEEYYDDG